MKSLNEAEKDRIWEKMQDYKILGMTRQDLDRDNGIISSLNKTSLS